MPHQLNDASFRHMQISGARKRGHRLRSVVWIITSQIKTPFGVNTTK